MDMKKILQAMDGASKVSTGADDEMKRFVSIIAEGKNPSNKPTQAEQIVVQHYSKKEPVVEKKLTTGIDQYFKKVEQELLESQSKKTDKSKKLAERVVSEIGGNYGHASKMRSHISKTKMPPEDIISMAKQGARQQMQREETEGVDSITLDVPLFIRLMEFAREDAQDDMVLHQIAERLIGMAEEGQSLSMSDYENIVGSVSEAHGNSKIYDKCWTGYKRVPGKKKNEPGSCEKK